MGFYFFFSSRRRHTRSDRDWSSDVCSSDLVALADQLAALPYLEASPNIIELARERKLRAVDVAKVYFRLGDALREPWLQEQIDALKVDGRWHAVARGVLRDELSTQMRTL